MIVTIDGPAGAGKSTVARRLAEKLEFDYLDTGATYRAVTWKAIDRKVNFHNPEDLARLARNTDIVFKNDNGDRNILCDGTDITDKIREPRITEKIHHLADEPEVRRALISLQRDYAEGRDVVTEGRDQGTEVFPDAEVKFYLDASAQTRAERRHKEMSMKNIDANFDDVLEAIHKRDEQDKNRSMGRLRLNDDMIVIDSTNLTIHEVVSRIKVAICKHPDSTVSCERMHA